MRIHFRPLHPRANRASSGEGPERNSRPGMFPCRFVQQARSAIGVESGLIFAPGPPNCGITFSTRQPSERLDPVVIRLLGLQAIIGATATGMLVWELGWPFTEGAATVSEWVTWGLVLLALVSEAGLAWKNPGQSKLKRYLILGALIALALGRFGLERPLRDWLGDHISPRSAALIALLVVQVTLVVPFAIRMMRVTQARGLQSARPGTLFVGGFAAAIVVGTLMLKTPEATVEGISWLDAFFTSTSSICVTGLIVVDTEHAFTPRGHAAILFLIQIGGLGIMTLTYFMSLMLGHGITLRDSVRLKDLFSEDNVGAMGKFVSRIVVLTLALEAAGAILIHLSWKAAPARSDWEWWDAVFHAVSAFCNAGFSTFSEGLADPAISGNRALQVVVMVLIVAGGLGFAVLHDLPQLVARGVTRILRLAFPRSLRVTQLHLGIRVRLHTRLTLQVTGLFLIGGAALFLLSDGAEYSTSRLWEAIFNSVTARTAGFHISDFGAYGFASVVLLCFLMFVGGSPGGTAGGIKTTTFAVAVGELGRLIRGHATLHLRGRRIPREIVERCTATVVMSLIWVVTSIFVVSWSHPHLEPVDVTFECFSAFGTVGLSRGITGDLNSFGKLVIIASMFAGRVGLLTLVLTLAGESRPRRYELSEGRLPLN